MLRRYIVAIVIAIITPKLLAAQSTAEWRSWNQPVPPFHVIDNIYYVGASDVSSYLITSPQGHILLDGGFVETAPIILSNIRTLGFNPRDVKVLLNSHAHFDHAGGLAELLRATGARFLASAADSTLLARGGHGDFKWGDSATFPPVIAEHSIGAGDSIKVGSSVLVAHLTPGHTKGCTTWTTTARDGANRRDVVFMCGFSAPDYRLVDNAAYPEIARDYRKSFAFLHHLPCDVLLGAHSWEFHLKDKMPRADATPNPFVNPAECSAYVAAAERNFEAAFERQQLEKERKASPPRGGH